MIVDTTYLLPLSRIEVDTDLLKLIAEHKIDLAFDEIGTSMISLFEIQAKAHKQGLQPRFPIEAIEAINTNFRVAPFCSPEIIETCGLLPSSIKDYIDRIIVATAIALKENLVTEDSRIRKARKALKNEFGIEVFSYKDLVAHKGR
ncbi:MAG: PIN domain-containing protein [Candidatus Marsarchaeota archaeon]|nr:PIN domain-containing protein [Candidatus Marsarchaeota archaeon]